MASDTIIIVTAHEEADMLGDTLEHDVVGVWILEPSGGLRLRASRGYGSTLTS